MFATKKKYKSLGNIPVNVACYLFDTFTLPVLNYASAIWCKTNVIPCIERVHLRFMKYLLGVKESTASIALYGELGRYPIYIGHCISLIKYWCNIATAHQDSLLRRAYNVLRSLQLAGYNTWLKKITDLLELHDMCDYWQQDMIEEDMSIINLFTNRVHEKFREYWKISVHEQAVLRTYIKFKFNFEIESYLLNIRDGKLRKLMAQFRLSSHVLNVEKGRQCKPKLPLEKRICQICQKLEDEQHFLLHCNLVQEERVHLFNNLLSFSSNVLSDNADATFVNLMSSVEEKVQFALCKFLQKAFMRRNNVVK